MRNGTRPLISMSLLVIIVCAIFLAGWLQQSFGQTDGFHIFQFHVFCKDAQTPAAIFFVQGTGSMGTSPVICVGSCNGRTVSITDAVAGLSDKVKTGLKAKVDEYQANATAKKRLTCLGEGKKPPALKCDNKKACEAIEAMQKRMAKYDGLLGNLPGSFAELNGELSKLMQQLSEALACRFNEGHNADDAKILNDFIGQLLRDRNSFSTLNNTAKVPQPISCDSDLGNPGSAQCRDHKALQRIKENLSRFAGVLGCSGPPQKGTPAKDCKELSNGVLDGLSTFFDELDKRKPKNQFGSGDAYDQVADGIEGALQELEAAAEEIEGVGGTGAQQYKDIQEKISKLKKILDVWGQIKSASCLPPDILSLLRKLATEKRAGQEHKATCTELCAETADWYVKVTGLPNLRSSFFKACTLACF